MGGEGIRIAAAILTSLAMLLAGCGSGRSATPTATAASNKLTSVTIVMGYFPNIQFAPFYMAQARGYYRAAGLSVHFRYGIEPDALREASAGKVQFAASGGDEVLAAGAQGLKVTYVMTQYATFPSALFSLRSTGIRSPAGLRGRSIGVPGLYGASYVGLLSLLQRSGIPRSAVQIKSIGFTQAQSVSQHKVDAAVGYAMNEPVQLRSEGVGVNEIDVYRYANLAGAGIAAGNQEIADHPQVVRGFVRATVHGLRDVLQNPNEAFRVSATFVKEINAQPRLQRAVLRRCLAFWKAEPGHPLGWADPVIWSRTGALLYEFKQIPRQVPATRYYTNRFISGSSP